MKLCRILNAAPLHPHVDGGSHEPWPELLINIYMYIYSLIEPSSSLLRIPRSPLSTPLLRSFEAASARLPSGLRAEPAAEDQSKLEG